ncbi:MAG: hypothetical protein R3B07_30530 [Polyangiaceae bacterium]
MAVVRPLAGVATGACLLVGCGSDDGGSAASGGAGGTAGSATAGSGGSAATGGSSSVGGASGSGTGATAGAAGTSAAGGAGSGGVSGSGGGSGSGGSAGNAGSGGSAGSGAGAFDYLPRFVRHLGGSRQDNLRDVAFTGDGGMVLVGGSFVNGTKHDLIPNGASANEVKTTCPSGTSGSGADMDLFVMRLDAAGQLLWVTTLGGPYYERAYGVEVASNGDIVLAGRAGKCAPIAGGPVQPSFGGDSMANAYGEQDGYVARLDSSGSLLWATYLGGSANEFIRDMALDSQGNVLVGTFLQPGSTLPAWGSGAFGTAFQTSKSGGEDSLVVKLAANGKSVLWASRLGGSGNDGSQPSIRVDMNDDSVVFMTHGRSNDFNANAGASQIFGAYPSGATVNHGNLVKLTSSGSHVFTRYLGASGPVNGDTHNLAVHTDGSIVVADSLCRDSGCFSAAGDQAGALSSLDPATGSGAAQPSYAGGGYPSGNPILGNYPGDAYVVRLKADGSVVAATLFGGSKGEGIEGVGLTAAGNVVISGATNSANLPGGVVTQGAYAGSLDAFVAVLSADLSRVLYQRQLGSAQDNTANTLVVRGDRILVGGATAQTNTLHISFQPQTHPKAHLTNATADGTQLLGDIGIGGDEDGWIYVFDELAQ